MKSTRKGKIWLVIISGVLALATAASPDHGVVVPNSAQAVGYDAWAIFVYAFFLWSLIKAVRARRRKGNFR
jgi:hypothetical protein